MQNKQIEQMTSTFTYKDVIKIVRSVVLQKSNVTIFRAKWTAKFLLTM